MRSRLLVVAFAALASFVASPLAAQDSVIDIAPGSPWRSELDAVNNRGQAVGWAEFGSTDDRRALLWQDGQMIDLGTLPGFALSGAFGINERGQIVGVAIDGAQTRAVLWDGGGPIDITPPGWRTCAARAINNRGDIAGNCVDASGVFVAVLWRGRNHDMTSLGFLPGYVGSAAGAINDAGVVSGNQFLEQGGAHAFRWADGVMTALPLPPGGAYAFASAINASGTIVGSVATATGIGLEPAIWQGGGVAPLSGTWGTVLGQAWGINDRGDVVGPSESRGGYVWSGGTFRSLPDPRNAIPFDINERGVAVGLIFPNGDVPQHGAVWPKALTRIGPDLR